MGTMIELGEKVTDEATGFSGTATARAEYLNGSARVQVSGFETDSGKPVEWWFDEGRLTVQQGSDA